MVDFRERRYDIENSSGGRQGVWLRCPDLHTWLLLRLDRGKLRNFFVSLILALIFSTACLLLCDRIERVKLSLASENVVDAGQF